MAYLLSFPPVSQTTLELEADDLLFSIMEIGQVFAGYHKWRSAFNLLEQLAFYFTCRQQYSDLKFLICPF